MKFDTLYAMDEKGKLRFWEIEVDDDCTCRYRTIAGLIDGKPVISEWRVATPTNVGKKNERNATAQCLFEVNAEYQKKKDRKYYESEELARSNPSTHKFFAPMLAQTFKSAKRINNLWFFSQPKLDGIRMIASRDGMFSRQGKQFDIPHLWHHLEKLFDENPNLILDGELYNHDLHDNFNLLTSLAKKEQEGREVLQYHIYDIPSVEEIFMERLHDLRNLREVLDPKLFVPVKTHILQNFDKLDDLYREYLEEGYEGQMIRMNEKYENKRSHFLLKRKEFKDAEFVIVDILEGEGNWSGYAKRVQCQLPDGRTFGAGIKGDQEFTKKLLNEKLQYLTVTIRYFELTPDGIPRFPVATAFHRDIKM